MAIAMKPILGSHDDDTLYGSQAHEVLVGYGGEDTIISNNGHDEAWGGTGDDYLYGNSGNDILYGGGSPKFVQLHQLQIQQDYQGSITFLGETAGYRNSLGSYKISQDGGFYDVQMHFANASLAGSGGDLIAGLSSSELSLTAGDQVGFFIVSNGYSYNNGYQGIDLTSGELSFVDNDNQTAGLDTTNPNLLHTSADGVETDLSGNTYHSAANLNQDTLDLNPDNLVHTVGRLNTDKGEMALGFEDLYNGGDLDFDDSIFSVDLGLDNARALAPTRNQSGTNHSDNDWLYGGNGNDELYGRAGDDHHFGGGGNDQIFAGSGNDNAEGGYGSDTIKGGAGNDLLKGDSGHDKLYGGLDDDTLMGGTGNDELHGNSGTDTLYGDSGSDNLQGGNGDDLLYGGSGNDQLGGGSGDDFISGGDGHDQLQGSNGDDILDGGAGSDTLKGGSGNDHFTSGTGRDQLFGGSGSDTVDYSLLDRAIRIDLHGKRSTGGDSDSFHSIENAIGSDYDDWFRGDLRANTLVAGDGNDTLRGAKGADQLTGGAGQDTYVWRKSDLNAVDEILDFSLVDDSLEFHFNLSNAELESFLSLTELESGVLISIDFDGDEDLHQSQDIVTLQNISNVTLEDFNFIA
ncbi:MAG: DUF4114 domain-containing protein [Cellvibrionaceae bacterium]